MRIFIIILWLLLTSFQVEVKAQNSALEGRVIDALSQNPLYGAHIYFPDLKTGTSSNEEGHFQMYIPAGQHRMRISYIGYDDIDTTIIIDQTKSVTFMMRSRLLKEVKIVADKLIPFNRKDAQGGSVLSLERAQFLPSFTGYPDPVKASLYLPGVSSSRDGASRIVIRGTEYDHHILAVDGVALPEYSHLFGLMSVMNPDLVQDVRVFKGAKPMVYSNVLGGVIDVRVASGSGEKTSNFTLGLLNSGYQQSGQLGKGSYNVGARISYFDIINLYPLLKNIREKSNFEIRFADAIDVGFKTQQPFLSGQLSMTVLGAFSNLGSKGEDLENYGGGYDFENYHYIQNNWVGLASIKSLHEIHSHWTWSNHLYVNANRPRLLGEDEGRNNANDNQFDRYFDNSDQYQSHRNMGYRSEWIRRNSENQKLSLGAQIESGHLITYKEFSEGLITLQEKSSTSATFSPFENQQSWTSLYANYGGSQEKWNYEGGIKAMYYFNQGQTILLPKVSLSYLLSGHSNLYFNYEASSQNKHIPYGDHLLLEYPQWIFVEKEEKISQSQRFNLGYNNNLVSGWEGNVEAFYQSFTNLSYYSIIDNSDQYYSLEASGGEGYNYGMELSLSKAWRNKSNLQLGYTWIKSERQYENINNGNSFRADYGREHELKIQFIFPYKKLLIGSQWTMASGFPFTIPNAVVHSNLLRNYNYISGKNNFSLPLYHRLDLSISRTLESKKGRKSIFSFNLFNAYNRFNADHIIPDFPSKKIKKISNFGVVPSFYYKLYIK